MQLRKQNLILTWHIRAVLYWYKTQTLYVALIQAARRFQAVDSNNSWLNGISLHFLSIRGGKNREWCSLKVFSGEISFQMLLQLALGIKKFPTGGTLFDEHFFFLEILLEYSVCIVIGWDQLPVVQLEMWITSATFGLFTHVNTQGSEVHRGLLCLEKGQGSIFYNFISPLAEVTSLY